MTAALVRKGETGFSKMMKHDHEKSDGGPKTGRIDFGRYILRDGFLGWNDAAGQDHSDGSLLAGMIGLCR